MLSIRTKVLILASLSVAIMAATVLPAVHLILRLEDEAAAVALETQARVEAARLGTLLDVAVADLRALARAPEVLALVAAPQAGGHNDAQAAGGGVAPGSAVLLGILDAMLERAPSWRHIGLEALAPPGRDALRVMRGAAGDGGAGPVASPEAGRGADLPQAIPMPGTSPVLLPGQVAPGILRLVEPVRAEGRRLGHLSVDIDLARLFLPAMAIGTGHGLAHLTVVPIIDPGEADRSGSGATPEARASPEMQGAGPAVAEARIGIGSGPERIEFRVLASVDPEPARQSGRGSVAAAILPILPILALAAVVLVAACDTTAPLAALSRALAAGQPVDAAVAPHLHASDEIGAIARAVEALGRELVESTGHFATIFRYAPVGIVSCDVDGTIVDMNPEAEVMFGFVPGAALGRSLDVLMPAAARGLHAGRLSAFDEHSSAMNADRDVAGLRQDGAQFPLSVTLGSVIVGRRKTIIGILRDVSERREAQEKLARLLGALEASKAELERSNGELDQFAYIASHDLKAPLRVIDNASLWLEEDLAEHLTEDTRESMELLRSRVHRMERLLDDLLAYSRVGRVAHRSTPVPASRILEEVIALVAPPEGFRVELGPGFDDVRLPEMPVSGVFLNLVSNAIKHHDRAEGQVRVSVEDLGASYAFTVEDDGPGIPAEYRDRVFGMFQTLRPRDEVEGSGMGLAFVRKTIESVNGTLTLSGKSDRGCVFRFTWPKPPDDPAEDTAQ